MPVLPRAPFERIIKLAGASRVSEEASEELATIIEDRLKQIFKEASLLAKHAGRKTIIDEDIRTAARKLGFK